MFYLTIFAALELLLLFRYKTSLNNNKDKHFGETLALCDVEQYIFID